MIQEGLQCFLLGMHAHVKEVDLSDKMGMPAYLMIENILSKRSCSTLSVSNEYIARSAELSCQVSSILYLLGVLLPQSADLYTCHIGQTDCFSSTNPFHTAMIMNVSKRPAPCFSSIRSGSYMYTHATPPPTIRWIL